MSWSIAIFTIHILEFLIVKVQRWEVNKLSIHKTAMEFWLVLLLGNSVPLLALLLTAGESRLTCQRSILQQNICQLTRWNWRGYQTQYLPLSDLIAAKVTKSAQSDETGAYFHYVVLQLKDRQIPLSISTVGADSYKEYLDEVATQIDEFISRDRIGRLDVRIGVTTFVMLLSVSWFAFALIVAIGVSSESFSTCIFDRDLGYLTISRRRCLKLQCVEKYPLNEIVAVELETFVGDEDKASRVLVKLRSGVLVPLTQDSYADDYHQTIWSIEQFLHLNYALDNL